MARYKQLPVGVLDTLTSTVITALESEAWQAFQAWVAAGNTPDPEDPPTAVPLPEKRLRRKLMVARSEANTKFIPIALIGTTFKFGASDIDILYGLALSVLNGNALPPGFGWKDTNGVFTAVGPFQFKTIIQKIGEHGYALRVKRWDKEDEIDAAVDPDTVDPSITTP